MAGRACESIAAMPSLKVLSGPNPDEVFPVKSGDSLGRDPANEITIPAPGISRKHVQFVVEHGETWIVDLGSVNGTFVNGEKVTRHKLAEGDTIALSEVQLRFARTDAPSPTKRFGSRRPAPPTEPLSVLKARSLLAEAESEQGEPEEAYSFDATGSVATAMDLRLGPAEQIASLQKRLTLMFEVSQALAVARDRDELFGKIVEKLFAVFPHAEHGYVLVGPSFEQLQPALVRDRSGGSSTKRPSISRTIAKKVFEQRRAIICQNAASDARFAQAQSIMALDLSSFMVAPLIYRDEVFGFIQLDSKRRFEKEDLNLLAGLAASAATFVKTLKLIDRVAKEVKEREEIQSELRIASRIQAGLLPKNEPAVPWLEIAARMKTAKEVGGDYYDYVETPSGEVYVAIGDVSGKGVPAGLVMVMARSILHSLLDGRASLRTVAVETNRLLKKDLKPGMFLSLLLAWCDSKTKTLHLAGCGHDRPLVFRARTGKVERLELGGTVLGVVADNTKQVAENVVQLEKGDQVLLFTDGVTEALDAASKPFGLARLEQTLAAHGREAPPALLEHIQAQLAAHARGRDQHDDITLIALRRK
jgi:sigma-B regulation protein RsbU (phosphoserine phosphatase)